MTGEKNTIARISNIYIPKRGYECFNACIVNSFARNKLELNSSDIFFSMGDKPLEENEKSWLEVSSSMDFLKKYDVYCENDLYREENIETFLQEQASKPDRHLILKIRPQMMGYSRIFSTNMDVGHYVNVIYADDKQIHLVDGYTPNAMESGYCGIVNIDELAIAWKAERNKYRIIKISQTIDLKSIRKEARKNLYRYINYSHYQLQNVDKGVPEHMVLRMFWNVIERIKQGEIFDNEFINLFFYDIRVRGFLIVNNMIWEKVYENSEEFAEEYFRIISKWKHILLFMRKYMMQKMTEKIVKLYDNILVLVKEENEFLIRVFGNE